MGFLEMFNYVDWEHESYPELEDFVVLPVFVLFFPAVRLFLDIFVFEVLVSWYGMEGGSSYVLILLYISWIDHTCMSVS